MTSETVCSVNTTGRPICCSWILHSSVKCEISKPYFFSMLAINAFLLFNIRLSIIGFRQCVLQHKASHARLTAVHQILMDSLEALLAVVIVCIDHDERGINHIFSSKHGLPSSPRLCTACRKFSRNIVDILESVVYSHIVRRTNGSNTITDDLFELLLDILTDASQTYKDIHSNSVATLYVHKKAL